MLNGIKGMIFDLMDTIKYDLLKVPFNSVEYPPVKTQLEIRVSNEGVFATSQDVKGLLFSAPTIEELPDALLDAWMTYYDVPRYQAKRVEENVEINLESGEVVSNNSVELNYA